MNDDIVTPNESRNPVVERRPVNYTSNMSGNGEKKEFRKLHVLIGDMIQIIDPKSHLCGKFALVEELHPRNPQYNIIAKIGPVRNPVKFSQVKFCARVSPTINNGLKNNATQNNDTKFEEEDNKKAINELIDVVDEEADSIGNREGQNLKHGKKL
jgi:hypothetical protein